MSGRHPPPSPLSDTGRSPFGAGSSIPPLLPYLLAYAAGLGGAHLFPLPFAGSAPLLWGMLALTLLAVLARRTPAGRVLLIIAVLGAGMARYQVHTAPLPDELIRLADGTPRSVEGTVVRVDPTAKGGSRIELRQVLFPLEEPPVAMPGRLRIQIEEGVPNFAAGERIRAWGRCTLPRPFGAPGEADPQIRLRAQGGRMQMKVARAADTIGLPAAREGGIARSIDRFRIRSGEWIDASLDTRQAGVLRSLLLGEKLMLPEKVRILLAQTGTAHLFSISGMHLGLIGALLYALLGWCYRRSTRLLLWQPPARVLPLLLIPVLAGYLLLTGGALPTRRAFLMLLLAGMMIWLFRRVSGMALMVAVAFALLLVEPLALFTPSFQLSFAGAAAILLIVSGYGEAQKGVVLRTTRVSLAAIFATTPIILYHFSQLAPGSLPANLIAIPLVGMLALPVGMAALLAAGIPMAGELLLRLSAGTIDLALWLLEGINGIALLAGRSWYPSEMELFGVALCCGGALLMLRFPRWRLLVPLAAGLLLVLLPPGNPTGVRVVAVSVGQGEATLLTLPGGRHWLIDGGGLFSEHFDIGERILLPALGRLGVRGIDTLVLTHDHPDHRQGLVAVLRHLPVGRVLLGRPLERHDPLFIDAVRGSGARVEILTPGWHEQGAVDGVEIALWRSPIRKGNLNDQSLVLHLNYGADSLLLTGDLEGAGVTFLLDELEGRQVTLLKLPHHGSWRSRPQALIETLRPEQLFVSAGYRNRYGLPSQETLDYLAGEGIGLVRTDTMGSLFFRTNGVGWEFSPTLRGDLY